MKVTIHCEGTPAEINKQLMVAAKVYAGGASVTAEDDGEEEKSHIDMAEIKAKRAKKSKAKVSEDDADDEADAEESEDESETDDEGENFDDAEDDEEEKLSEEDLTKLKKALKAYSNKNDKKKTVAVLKKFAERSDLVKPADLGKLLKLLKV